MKPFLAFGNSSAFSSSNASPSYFPNLGSINFEVSNPPTNVRTNTDTILKYQLSTGVTVNDSSKNFDASVEIPASNATVPATNKFVVNTATASQIHDTRH